MRHSRCNFSEPILRYTLHINVIFMDLAIHECSEISEIFTCTRDVDY